MNGEFPKPISRAMVWLIGRRQALLVLMLGLLHLVLVFGINTPAGRILMLPHLALFLLWQPFVNAQSRIGTRQMLTMIVLLTTSVFWLNWVMMGLWLILLAGMVGGRVFFYSQRSTRLFYLTALIYLMVMLLLSVMPRIVPGALVEAPLIHDVIRLGLPVLIVVMALLPESDEKFRGREAIDLAYSVFLMLLLAVLTLGSVALMLVQHVEYIQALMITVLATAAMLLVTSWLWNPGAGFSGLGAVTSRYMLSIGLPFEQWLRSLSELAQRESDPAQFLDEACADMAAQLPWVKSCTWADASAAGAMPIKARFGMQTAFRQGELVLTLTTQEAMSPVMVWHVNLVTELVARFHAEKKRDLQLREMEYMQAVHETGARVTHDVKNLLQSLHALLYVIADPGAESTARAQPLLQRQLPVITQRLQQTLDKLHEPELASRESVVAADWWRDLRARYESRAVKFASIGDLRCTLPANLFDSAAENLLQNALDKRAGETNIEIAVTLDTTQQMPTLLVSDSGSAVPVTKAAEVGQRPVASENGLGIGLYQLARIASMANYALVLSDNREGSVCFNLVPQHPGV